MFKIHLGDTPNTMTDADFQELGRRTEGFSGSDCSVVVKDVLMQPIRVLREATHFKKITAADGSKSAFSDFLPFLLPCARCCSCKILFFPRVRFNVRGLLPVSARG